MTELFILSLLILLAVMATSAVIDRAEEASRELRRVRP